MKPLFLCALTLLFALSAHADQLRLGYWNVDLSTSRDEATLNLSPHRPIWATFMYVPEKDDD